MEDFTVSVLGTDYVVHYTNYEDDDYARRENVSGYCDFVEQRIIVVNDATIPIHAECTPAANRIYEKETLRHEIIHAFLFQSGLDAAALPYSGAWARNEEMIDWFAMQGPKIIKAWQEADAL